MTAKLLPNERHTPNERRSLPRHVKESNAITPGKAALLCFEEGQLQLNFVIMRPSSTCSCVFGAAKGKAVGWQEGKSDI